MSYYQSWPLEYRRLHRDVRICHHGPDGRIREVGYPFENGLADLPLAQRWECAWGYLRAAWTKPRAEFRNLREWIDSGLGHGIARHFMAPYNEKIWSHPLEGISLDLVNKKIDPEPPWRVISHALLRGSVGRSYQADFLYPPHGAGALPEAIASGLRDRIATGWRVRRLLPGTGASWRILSENGQEFAADAIVSTIPVPELLAALGEDGPDRAAFVSNDTYFVAVGLKPGRSFARFSRCHWVFFAGPELFYRASLMDNFSELCLPTLVAEITVKGAAAGMQPDAIGAFVLRDLKTTGILPEESAVEFVDVRLERYTYPIPTLGLAAARRRLEAGLERRRVFLLGRSGRWDYLNTDGIFRAVEDFAQKRLPELARLS